MGWVKRDRPDDGDAPKCTFCDLPTRGDDRASNIVVRSNHTYIFLNNMSYNPGRVMTIPYKHTGEYHLLDENVLFDCMRTSQLVIMALDRSLSPSGFNIGFNIGAAGGASIPDHLHMHVIPRWDSDTSFMPLMANTAIMEEAIDETYSRLRDALLDIKPVSEGKREAVEISYD